MYRPVSPAAEKGKVTPTDDVAAVGMLPPGDPVVEHPGDGRGTTEAAPAGVIP